MLYVFFRSVLTVSAARLQNSPMYACPRKPSCCLFACDWRMDDSISPPSLQEGPHEVPW